MKKWIFTFSKKDAPNVTLQITIEYSREIQSSITAIDKAWQEFKTLQLDHTQWCEVDFEKAS